MNAKAQRWAVVAALPLLLAGGIYGANQVELSAVTGWLAGTPKWVLVFVVFTAPLLGFPLSALLLVVGASFSLPLGLALLLAVLAFHHLLLRALTGTAVSAWLREQLRRRSFLPDGTRTNRRLADDILFITAATWVPGLSYIFTIALTAVADFPFRTYFLIGVLSQTIAALPYLLLGDVAKDIGLGWLSLGVFVLAGLSWSAKRVLFGNRHAAPPDRRRSGAQGPSP